jgi:hypothetical protein
MKAVNFIIFVMAILLAVCVTYASSSALMADKSTSQDNVQTVKPAYSITTLDVID